MRIDHNLSDLKTDQQYIMTLKDTNVLENSDSEDEMHKEI